jgi:hypothetical protein
VNGRVGWLAAILLVTAALHGGSLRNGFYWDDRAQILEGKLIGSWKNIPDLFLNEGWHNVDLGERKDLAEVDTYRPLFNLSLLVDHACWGLRPEGYHFTNVAIHLINTALLFWLLSGVSGLPLAVAATLLFSLHPLTVEPVAYVSARTDSLPLLFGLSGLLFVAGNPSRWAAASLLMLFSALSKETGLSFAALWITDTVVRRRGSWIYPAMVPTIYFFLRRIALGESKALLDTAHLFEAVLNFPRYLGRFARQFLLPADGFPMQSFEMVRIPGTFLSWILAAVFWVALCTLLWRGFRNRRPWLGFVVGLVSSLLIPFMAVSLTGETSPRYFYAALPYASIAFSALVMKFAIGRRGVFVALVICSVALLGTRTVQTSGGYRTEEGFYRWILRSNPGAKEAVYNLANTLARSGRWSEGIPLYEKLIGFDADQPRYWNNLGVSFLNVGRFERAREAFERAISLSPQTERYRKNLALVGDVSRRKIPLH